MSQYVDDVPEYSDQKKNTGLAAVSHILGLVFGLIGPIVIYAISDDEFVRKNAAKAFTWQVFFLLYFFLAIFSISLFVGILLIPLVYILNIIFSVLGAVKAGNGEVWKYPGTVDLLEKSEEQPQNQRRRDGRQRNQNTGRKASSREDLTEERLKQMYIDGEISEEEFDKKLDKIQRREQMERDYN